MDPARRCRDYRRGRCLGANLNRETAGNEQSRKEKAGRLRPHRIAPSANKQDPGSAPSYIRFNFFLQKHSTVMWERSADFALPPLVGGGLLRRNCQPILTGMRDLLCYKSRVALARMQTHRKLLRALMCRPL